MGEGGMARRPARGGQEASKKAEIQHGDDEEGSTQEGRQSRGNEDIGGQG